MNNGNLRTLAGFNALYNIGAVIAGQKSVFAAMRDTLFGYILVVLIPVIFCTVVYGGFYCFAPVLMWSASVVQGRSTNFHDTWVCYYYLDEAACMRAQRRIHPHWSDAKIENPNLVEK